MLDYTQRFPDGDRNAHSNNNQDEHLTLCQQHDIEEWYSELVMDMKENPEKYFSDESK